MGTENEVYENCGYKCFAFVSRDIYLVVRCEGPGYISIYRITPHREVARLFFPELTQGVALYSAFFEMAPVLKNPPAGCHFVTSLENKFFSVRLLHEQSSQRYFDFTHTFAFILAKTFLFYALIDSCGPIVNTVPWST